MKSVNNDPDSPLMPQQRDAMTPSIMTPVELAPYYSGASGVIPPAVPQGGGMGIWVHAFRRRWPWVVALGTLCAALSAAIAWQAPKPQYTATALLQVAAGENQILPGGPGASQVSLDLYKNTQQELLKSDFVLLAALQDKRLKDVAVLRQESDPVRWLASQIKVDSPTGTQVIRVRFSGDNAKAAASIVNAVVDAYMNEVVNKESGERRSQAEFLKSICTEKEDKLRAKRAALESLSKELGMSDSTALAAKQQIDLAQLGEYRKECIRLQIDRTRLEGERKLKEQQLAEAAKGDVSDVELDAFARTDPATTQILAQRDALQLQLSALVQALQPEAQAQCQERYQQRIKTLTESLADRRKAMREEYKYQRRLQLEKEFALIRSQLDVANEQYRQFEEECKRSQSNVKTAGGTSIDILSLQGEIAQLERFLNPYLQERDRLELEIRRTAQRVTSLQPASPPTSTDKTRQVQFAAAAALGGFFLPGIFILLWDVRGKRIGNAEEVSDGLGLAVLGNVPMIPSRAMQERAATSRRHRPWRSLLTEAVNSVVVRLLREGRESPLKLILISSATSGEGKTTLATQIAMSMARSGRRTLLVDCDLRRPTLDRILGTPLEPGVSELLQGTAELEEAVEETAIANLSLLTAGHWLDDGLEVLTSGAVGTLFGRLRGAYDFVVIDGSPLLPVPDARILAQHADAVILSILCDVSQTPKVQVACRILNGLGVQTVASVVTGTSEEVYYRNYGYHSRVPA